MKLPNGLTFFIIFSVLWVAVFASTTTARFIENEFEHDFSLGFVGACKTVTDTDPDTIGNQPGVDCTITAPDNYPEDFTGTVGEDTFSFTDWSDNILKKFEVLEEDKKFRYVWYISGWDLDGNYNPYFSEGSSTTRSISENTGTGAAIGGPVSATGVDEDDILTYSLSGTDAASFSIDSSTGQLRTAAALDYETKNTYAVTVIVSDEYGGADTMDVTINITKVSETVVQQPSMQQNNLPVFSDGTSTTRSITENTGSGIAIGNPVSATDADTGNTLTYSLSGTDAASFSIVSTSGQLQTGAALDYETKSSYSVSVSVSDGNVGSDSITVTINVIDVNETVVPQPPVKQPDDTQQPQQPVSPPVQQPDDTQQTTVQTPVSTGGGGGQITNPTPTEPVNHTVKPFDYERKGVGKIVFSEWMLSTLNDTPQWIELYNTTHKAISLKNWKIVGRFMDGNNNVHLLKTHTISSLRIKAKQTHLIVAYSATLRGGFLSDNVRGKVYSLHQNGKLWGGKAFVLELQDANGTPIDRIGNINEQDQIAWKIPSRTRQWGNTRHRISLIRRLKSVKSRKYTFRFGMTAYGWFPANKVEKLTEKKRSEYFYGSPTDIGTPGYRTEGADPLPVTLSYFAPQVSEDGSVVLSWTTASELENAGFNIFRSEEKEGVFVKVNRSLIQGAGTTSDRNAYTWIDTTAKPNVEYYYQIEDVSFDGLSEAIAMQRLKGIFTAKHRLLTSWARVKNGTE